MKVNAPVDVGIAEIVSLLNSLPDLQTVDSCEGIPGRKPAHVYFYYGDWQRVSRFMFAELGPALCDMVRGASVEVFNGSEPMARLSFEPEATQEVASVLKRVIYERPKL